MNLFSLDSFLLILNCVVTIFCGIYIFNSISSGKLERHPFYYFWAIGFILYGFEIVTRTFFISTVVIGVLLISSNLCFISGLWFLSRRKMFFILYLTFFMATLSSLIFLFSIQQVSVESGKIFASFMIYGGLVVLLLYHRAIFGKIADRFVLGWLLLFTTNLLLPTEWFATNIFAILSKIVLLTGVIDQNFAILMKKVQNGITATHLPSPYTGYENEGKLKLIKSSNVAQSHKINWLKQAVKESVGKGNDFYVFSFQDVIPHGELQSIKWIDPNKVKIFNFSSGANRDPTEFTTLPIDLTIIGATLSEAMEKHSSTNNLTIFMNLSNLIHLFGGYPVYNLLLNKIGSLRDKGVELLVFLNPKTHNDKSLVSLFESVVDEIIKL